MTLPLSKEQIEAIQARAEKATPGPWYHRQAGEHHPRDPKFRYDWIGDSPNQRQHKRVIISRNCIYGGTPDYAFIAAARTDIPALCQQALRAVEMATKLAVTEFGFNTLERERDELQSDKDRLTKALEDVCNPLDKLTRDAEAVGGRLSNAAYGIANNLSFVQDIARAALAPPSTSQSEGEG